MICTNRALFTLLDRRGIRKTWSARRVGIAMAAIAAYVAAFAQSARAVDPPPEDTEAITVTIDGIALRIPAGMAIEMHADDSVQAEVDGTELILDGSAVTIPEGPGGSMWVVSLQSKEEGFIEVSAEAGTSDVKSYDRTIQMSIDNRLFRLDGADVFELLPGSSPFEIASDDATVLVDATANQQVTINDGLYSWSLSVSPARGGHVHITLDVSCTASPACDSPGISCSASGPNAHCECHSGQPGVDAYSLCTDGVNVTRCRRIASNDQVCDTRFVGPTNDAGDYLP